MTQEYKLGGWNVVGALARGAVFGDVWFVDGDNGSDDNPGDQPNIACASITGAVTNAARTDVIYVRPRCTVASAQTYYADNITIPITKPNLQIIGCGDPDRPFMGVCIKATTVTSAVLTISGSCLLLEAIEWTGTGQTADTASIINTVAGSSDRGNIGLTIRNCTLRAAKGHLISAGGAIYLDTPNHVKIQACNFEDNLNSIAIRSIAGAYNKLYIEDCVFGGATSGRDVDIFSTGDAGSGFVINNCRFTEGLPAHGVVNKYISISSGPTGCLSNCRFSYAATTMDALIAAAGTIANLPTTMTQVGNMVQADSEGESGIVTI